MDFERLLGRFSELYGSGGDCRKFFAPGRVNLIGEHTDYNGGNVFPCALNLGTYAVVRRRTDRNNRLYSMNFPELGIIEFSLDGMRYQPEHDWANYPKGVLVEFQKRGVELTAGWDMLFAGTIPSGAGLSSSASIEVLAAVIARAYTGASFDGVQLALIGQAAENSFIGVKCGIMDQFASSMGMKNHAILLDCNSLIFSYVPFSTAGYALVIANTNKRRELTDSQYNQRRRECQQGLACLQTRLPIKTLAELDVATLTANRDAISDRIVFRRVRHAVSENQRTLAAVAALEKNNLRAFGELMRQSHVSLRDDYEVTGHELDSLVSAAWLHPGCIGARMTGAGFGGCTVNLVAEDQLGDFIVRTGDEYTALTGLTAEFYTVSAGDGARELEHPDDR
ncbi:MAG: galactokinase [Negativicutes bacterium]|nr:galactokinase [Negativicutes bacterium]